MQEDNQDVTKVVSLVKMVENVLYVSSPINCPLFSEVPQRLCCVSASTTNQW